MREKRLQALAQARRIAPTVRPITLNWRRKADDETAGGVGKTPRSRDGLMRLQHFPEGRPTVQIDLLKLCY
jgi:hypothetical protein